MTIKEFFGFMPNDPNLNIEFKSATYKFLKFRLLEVHEDKVVVYFDYPDKN